MLVGLTNKMNWQQTNREHRYKYTGDNEEHLEGLETSTKTGETDQGVTIKDWGVFQDKQRNGMEPSTGKILEENLVQSASQQPLEDIHLSAGDKLKHKAKSTLELLSKKTVNVPEWPSYSLDLNLLENQWHDLNIFV